MLPAALVLSIMILPTITAISRDALVSVPSKLRMAAYGLGATQWETILAVIIPTALRGIFGAVVLGFGRALGETMALGMLVGNANQISVSLFSPANTLAALLANNFPEAGPKEVGVLMYAALVLLGITLLTNMFGAVILQRASVQLGGKQIVTRNDVTHRAVSSHRSLPSLILARSRMSTFPSWRGLCGVPELCSVSYELARDGDDPLRIDPPILGSWDALVARRHGS